MPRGPPLLAVTLLVTLLPTMAADGSSTSCPAAGATLDCTPIRPGARLTEPYVCTLGFVFADAQGGLYVGTAGHCTDHAGQRVSARGAPDFGEVAFRAGAGSPADFALLRVDEEDRALVSPRVCGMGGPTGAASGPLARGAPAHLHGQGVGVGDAPPARGRDGVLLTWGATRWGAAIASVPGDSGAPLLLPTGEAAGHVTGISGGFTFIPGRDPTTPTVSGPRLGAALASAEAATGLDLHLLTAPLATPEERARDAAAAAFAC